LKFPATKNPIQKFQAIKGIKIEFAGYSNNESSKK
jgi:hypothetical protein